MAGAEGLELSTSGFGDRRSSQLSYAPIRTSTESAFHTLRCRMSRAPPVLMRFVRPLAGAGDAGDGKMERVTGIEPAQPAWKAGTLPLSYTRSAGPPLRRNPVPRQGLATQSRGGSA